MSGKYGIALKLYRTVSGVKNAGACCVPMKVAPQGLKYCRGLTVDKLNIAGKTPLEEFKRYLVNWEVHGEKFVPRSDNPQSTFMEYFNFKKKICKPQPAVKCGGMSFPARPAPPKIVVKGENQENYLVSLLSFKNFMQRDSKFATKDEYYRLIDEIALMMPKYVRAKYPTLRPEIAERSGDIFRWRSYLDVENKVDDVLVRTKFFDQGKKDKALKEYVDFVEELTGKKVLVGCPSRMTIAPDELGLLNDPASYKDVDYILFGHGKGSSLIKDINHPDTWRFSDSGESVWKYIEANVSKGKRVLVGACEQDKYFKVGGFPKERRALAEMYDKSGNYMYGIGDTVSAGFGMYNPAKVCESGTRHIIGHKYIEKYKGSPDDFINSCYGDVKSVYYDL